ncbi:putative ATPase, Rnase L inhibitor (RLI) like protein [Candidatus Methanoperedens nitroreducens]|uniref:Putative ATPase, Rnase L inhibitor (RLI) like protein n=1 Tax=Candidatus Methanoperedens nitratireducens TaxID=1392998 RepID=A0A062VB03_9EURY|nr:ribosome biogenesis/translation initiation ATPase RLI [Candidatus Methanoperedens nitroreducens]KCZ72889.1 putative ATPase, Rnase L inhibitor (RLI) like protein [Candidatus Methanoperedens nitroreducens]MDJ1423183.1 ribosome biogenesis/translation initiation ATPase RLI [Candidatus Methanoperedens sp.]
MKKRLAILDRDRCQPRLCDYQCIKFCPRVRTGDETIIIGEDGKPIISEELCVGCGICIKRCPFDAITIIGLPEKLEEPTHRYGINGFVLYGLPVPTAGKVTGILGQNGIGKSTAVNILSGTLKPNLGKEKIEWDEILKYYAGSALHGYLEGVSKRKIKTSQKPQYVDMIPRKFKGKVWDLLSKTDERGVLMELLSKLDITGIVDRRIEELSGGELQRVALAACIARDADFYFIDEISPYLDIYQRIKAAHIIRELAEKKAVMVVEHDLAILDLLADVVHIAYGTPGAFGVITHPKGIRVGINEYLKGFLREENVRIRTEAIEFEVHAPQPAKDILSLLEYGQFSKKYEDGFELIAEGGEIRKGEVTGIVGPNGIGKSTFIKILAGEIEPTTGKIDMNIKVSYKPQYIKADETIAVADLLRSITKQFDTSYYQTEILRPLQLERLLNQSVNELSGGELQRVAIAACLSHQADLYLLDEPSAHLDVEQRVLATKVIRRFAENNKVTAMVVDHDIYMIDMLSDRLLVFEGQPMLNGEVYGPFDMREGMNRFLKNVGITFRRDEETKRPRVNKLDSRLDRAQKAEGEYYYTMDKSY